jgi:hypothetical protein
MGRGDPKLRERFEATPSFKKICCRKFVQNVAK